MYYRIRFCHPLETVSLLDKISACIDDVSSWSVRANRLQLNPSNTEVLWCSSQRRQHRIPTICIGSTAIQPVSSVRDLGVLIDSDLDHHEVVATVRSCFAARRQIRSVRRSLTRQTLLSLVRTLAVSKVDYSNSVLAGVSAHLLDRLQSVLNAAARLILSARRSENISPLLRELHCRVASSGANSIPVVCSGLSLPSLHSAVVLGWQSTPCRRCRRSSSPPLGQQCRWSFHQLGAQHSASATAPFL